MSELLLDRAGRRRSPATKPGFHAGRPPRNKGLRYPADRQQSRESASRRRRSPAHSALLVARRTSGARVVDGSTCARRCGDRHRRLAPPGRPITHDRSLQIELSDNAPIREPADTPDFIVAGERVALGPLRRELASTYARWMNELEVRRGLDLLGVETPESQEKWVSDNLERGAKREPEEVEFTVYDRSDPVPVGTAGLLHVSHAHRRATFGIAIGERRGQVSALKRPGSSWTSVSTCCICAT